MITKLSRCGEENVMCGAWARHRHEVHSMRLLARHGLEGPCGADLGDMAKT